MIHIDFRTCFGSVLGRWNGVYMDISHENGSALVEFWLADICIVYILGGVLYSILDMNEMCLRSEGFTAVYLSHSQ